MDSYPKKMPRLKKNNKFMHYMGNMKMEREGYTLFLDRDGVINERLPGRYVSDPNDFVFIDGVLDSIKALTHYFDRIVVVTNQQGIGKKLMSHGQIEMVHLYMIDEIKAAGGDLDAVYYCAGLATDDPRCRKPNIGMGEAAKNDFPDIDFAKSIMVGDSISDIEFGQRLGMETVLIDTKEEEQHLHADLDYNVKVSTLAEWVAMIDVKK